MKAYTDLKQSKKLAEILPLESADMYYKPSDGFCTEPSKPMIGDIKYAHPRSIPCWSLAACLVFLPNYQLQTQDDGIGILCSCNGDFNIVTANNPVDACYEMIIKLKENNLL